MEYAELERFIKQIYGIIKHSMPTEAAEMMTQLEKLVSLAFFIILESISFQLE